MPASQIRVRHPGGAATVKIEPTTTLAELQALILSASGLEPAQQDVKLGYPPKSVDLAALASNSLIADPPLSLKGGAQIIVAKSDGVVRGSAGAAAPSVPASTSAQQAGPTASGSSSPSPASARLTSQPGSASNSSSAAAPSRSLPPPLSTTAHPTTHAQVGTEPQPRLTRKKRTQIADGEVYVQVDGGFGFLVLRVTEDDNSCLFHAFSFAQRQVMGEEPAFELRQKVAQAITQHEEYSDVILGHPRDEYIHKILSPQVWGGAIEISILSKIFECQVNAIDVRTGVVHRFGEGDGYQFCCYLVYSGIHYDVLALLPVPDAPVEYSTTLFETDSKPIEDAAEKLVAELRERKYFTDTATFALRCGECGTTLAGEKAASAHAQQTGHTDFGELDD
ncbi:ubiquitin-specific protease otu1 [Tilletia horrida]|nr:ubiquitin-specific protease otu1 [Tilletia horrida]